MADGMASDTGLVRVFRQRRSIRTRDNDSKFMRVTGSNKATSGMSDFQGP